MKKLIGYLSLATGLAASAFAWGNPGHMAVASAAYNELTPAERTKIVALLRKHPDLGPITSGFDGKISDRELFIAVATWPDIIRNGHGYANNGYEETAPAVTEVKSTDKQVHPGWHFYDNYFWHSDKPVPASLPKTPAVNAVGVINVLVRQLKSNEADAQKGFDLAWLFHLVGDLHQPLHAVAAVSPHQPNGDHGGNWVLLRGVKGESNLHGFWDHLAGKSGDSLEDDVATADTFVKSLKSVKLEGNSESMDPAVWTSESFAIAKTLAYTFETISEGQDSKGNPTIKAILPDGYDDEALQTARLRVKLGGHRLALILKDIVK
jgi:hypothetical protein